MQPVKTFFEMQDLYTGIAEDLTFQDPFFSLSSCFYVSRKRKHITQVQQIDVLSKKQFDILQECNQQTD